jgi:serine/threonine protein kinase
MEETAVGQKRPRPANGDLPIPKWKVELPPVGAGDEQFGGCRDYETSYHRSNQIGEGTYGQVYVATDLQDRSQVALKKVRLSR